MNTAPANVEEAEALVDELARLRWALLTEGRCPKCEGLIEGPRPEEGETVQATPRHAGGCPVQIGVLEGIADAWEIRLASAVAVGTNAQGQRVMYVGPVRAAVVGL